MAGRAGQWKLLLLAGQIQGVDFAIPRPLKVCRFVEKAQIQRDRAVCVFADVKRESAAGLPASSATVGTAAVCAAVAAAAHVARGHAE
jgi:hypothetical protein